MSSPLGSTRPPAAGPRRRSVPAPAPAASGLPAAEHQRGDEQPQLVDLAGVEERAGERRAALDQQRGDPRGGRARRAPRASRALAVAGELDHLGAGAAQGVDPRRVGAGGGEARRAAPGRASRTSAESSGSRARGVEDHPRRLADRVRDRRRRARSAAGRRRARCRSRPRPRRPRRASGGRARGSRARRSTASRRRGVAVKPSRLTADFSVTSGRPVRACLRNGWFGSRAAAASAPSANSTSTPSSRRMPGPRPRAFSVGSSEPITTRPMPAARIASVQGGWRPWCAQGSSVTYMRRAGRVGAAARGSRRSRRPRRARRRARRGSPRR